MWSLAGGQPNLHPEKRRVSGTNIRNPQASPIHGTTSTSSNVVPHNRTSRLFLLPTEGRRRHALVRASVAQASHHGSLQGEFTDPRSAVASPSPSPSLMFGVAAVHRRIQACGLLQNLNEVLELVSFCCFFSNFSTDSMQ